MLTSYSLLAVFFVAATVDPQCQALIDANTQSLELIRTIQADLIATSVEPTKLTTHITWSRDGNRERIRRDSDAVAPTPDGLPRGISDVVLDGDTYKWLRNWDPDSPQKITPTRQGTVLASIAPRTNVNPAGISPSHALLFEVYPSPRWTLRELAHVSPHVTCRQVEVDGRKLWLIKLETPEETTASTIKRYFDVYLDPAAGHMIRKVVMHAPKILFADGKSTSDRGVNEVLKFEDLGDGIFVPGKVRIQTGPTGALTTDIVVENIKVKQPIAPETFEMKWPKFAAVHYYPPVDGKVRFAIWGDETPLREFAGPADLRAFEAELRTDPLLAAELGPLPGEPLAPPPSTMMRLAVALGVLLLIMGGLVVWRRMREQAA